MMLFSLWIFRQSSFICTFPTASRRAKRSKTATCRTASCVSSASFCSHSSATRSSTLRWFSTPPNSLFLFCLLYFLPVKDTGFRVLMRGIANLPQGNQKLSVVKDNVGRPPGEFRVSKSIGCDFSIQCFATVGWATGRASGL